MSTQLNDPTSARSADPLSPITRNYRKWLLFSSLLGVLFVQVGLVPDELSILGTDFSNWDEMTLVAVTMSVTLFYHLSFIASAVPDYFLLRMRIMAADTRSDTEYRDLIQRQADGESTDDDNILAYRMQTHAWIFSRSNAVMYARLIIELVIPVAFGTYSLGVTFHYVFLK